MHHHHEPDRGRDREGRKEWSSSDYLVLEGLSGLDEEFSSRMEDRPSRRSSSSYAEPPIERKAGKPHHDSRDTSRVSLPQEDLDFSPPAPRFDAVSAFRTARERRAAQEREAAQQRSAVRRREFNDLRKFEPEFVAFFTDDPPIYREPEAPCPPPSPASPTHRNGKTNGGAEGKALPFIPQVRDESAKTPDPISLKPRAPKSHHVPPPQVHEENLEIDQPAPSQRQTVLPKPRKTRPPKAPSLALGEPSGQRRLVSPEPHGYDGRGDDDSLEAYTGRRKRRRSSFLPSVLCSFLLTTLVLLALAVAFLKNFDRFLVTDGKIQQEVAAATKNLAGDIHNVRQRGDENATIVSQWAMTQDQSIKLLALVEQAKHQDNMAKFKELQALIRELRDNNLALLAKEKQTGLVSEAVSDAKNHSLSLDQLFLGNRKIGKEADLSAEQLQVILLGADVPTLERARAAYLLRDHGSDQKIVSDLARIAFDQDKLSLALVAYDSLVHIAAFDRSRGYDPDGLKAALQFNIEKSEDA